MLTTPDAERYRIPRCMRRRDGQHRASRPRARRAAAGARRHRRRRRGRSVLSAVAADQRRRAPERLPKCSSTATARPKVGCSRPSTSGATAMTSCCAAARNPGGRDEATVDVRAAREGRRWRMPERRVGHGRSARRGRRCTTRGRRGCPPRRGPVLALAGARRPRAATPRCRTLFVIAGAGRESSLPAWCAALPACRRALGGAARSKRPCRPCSPPRRRSSFRR